MAAIEVTEVPAGPPPPMVKQYTMVMGEEEMKCIHLLLASISGHAATKLGCNSGKMHGLYKVTNEVMRGLSSGCTLVVRGDD